MHNKCGTFDFTGSKRIIKLYDEPVSSASGSVKRRSDIPAGAFRYDFAIFPVLFQAQATGYWRKLFMSTSFTTYSSNFLLNTRFEVARVQYISPVVASTAKLPAPHAPSS